MAKRTKKETSPVQPGEVQNTNAIPKDTAELEAHKAAELEAQKQAELEAQKQAEAKERTALGYHEYNGRKYTFTASMPNRVNLDGAILSKEEILSNPDVMEAMIDSKNIFIKEI